MPVPLSRSTLGQLPAIRTPDYDVARVRAGIVHLGLGNFHRAHMARYTHALMELDAGALGWGILGAGLLPADKAMRDALARQDWLYTLTERDAGGSAMQVIGSLAGMIFAGEDSAALIHAIADPAIRIVSLTVTGHGYCLDADKRLDPLHPVIAADLADPARPHSAIGILAEALRRRRDAGAKAFTALSCDNIQHNGRVLRQAVLDFAALRDPALVDWIAEHARFPSTMVDRITPVTCAENAAALLVADSRPVFSETFSQWVIEDDFADGRPDWDRVGAQFVFDVAPYETMKLRLLNASHLAIAGPARLMGYGTIDGAMRDPLVVAYMTALMECETGPTVPSVPGIDLIAYKRQLIERFANPTIGDTVDRVNADATIGYLLDPIRDRLAARQPIELLALGVAAWIKRMRGVDERGEPIEVRHPLAQLLRARALEGGSDPCPVLAIKSVFGALGIDDRFIAPVAAQLARLDRDGIAETLRRAVER